MQGMSSTAKQISHVPRPCFVSNYSITQVLKFKYCEEAGILLNHLVHFHPFKAGNVSK